jgi:hypothetical protein
VNELGVAIFEIKEFPKIVRAIYQRVIDKELLETPIRESAWTCRQVFHHLADSHMNSYIRLKLALTEDNPTVKPYAEPSWATLDDVTTVSPEVSLQILEGIHSRISAILPNLSEEQLGRTFFHPEVGDLTVRAYIFSFASHGQSHIGSIRKLLDNTS